MTATELKAKVLAVLDDVESGAEVEVTKRGRLVARIVPAKDPHSLRGKFADIASSVDDEDLYSTGEKWNAN